MGEKQQTNDASRIEKIDIVPADSVKWIHHEDTKDTKAGNNFSFVNFVSFVVNCLEWPRHTRPRSRLFIMRCGPDPEKEFRPVRSDFIRDRR